MGSTNKNRQEGGASGESKSSGKEQRLAAALRANLRRRKAQSVARKDLSESAGDSNTDGQTTDAADQDKGYPDQ